MKTTRTILAALFVLVTLTTNAQRKAEIKKPVAVAADTIQAPKPETFKLENDLKFFEVLMVLLDKSTGPHIDVEQMKAIIREQINKQLADKQKK